MPSDVSPTDDEDAQDSIGAFDFVMANPPFNVNGVDREKIKSERVHYPFGVPSVDNANYLVENLDINTGKIVA